MKHRFIILGPSHLPLSRRYSSCAFTCKIIRLAKILCYAGHEVVLLGASDGTVALEEYINSDNFRLIKTHDCRDISIQYGDGSTTHEIGYDWTKENFRTNYDEPCNGLTRWFYRTCIDYIDRNAKQTDFILVTLGLYHLPIINAVTLPLTCESGIGYNGWCPSLQYHSFESYAIRNYLYGKIGRLGTGKDRVIPLSFDINDFSYSDTKKDYMLFIGRMNADKGVTTAVKAAESAGVKLVIAGQGATLQDDGVLIGGGFMLAPGNWEYVGYINTGFRRMLLSEARAVFTPSVYIEPFCAVGVEARLSGTPVIASDWGPFPEQILEGVDGWCCNTDHDFANAAKTALTFSPDQYARIRARALRFDMNIVINEYQKWFDDIWQATR